MPYTDQGDRLPQFPLIDELSRAIKTKGDLNHAICELTALMILNHGGMGYTNVSNWVDAVGGAHDELRRRLLDPYEDKKIKDNGDLRSFIELLKGL